MSTMWELRNNTPFEAEWMAAIDKDGRRRFVVVVKGTFDIQPDGSTTLAKEPLPIAPAPEYLGEPGSSSLKFDADLVPPKPGTDLHVIGSAIAPEGKPTTNMTVSLKTPRGIKSLRVVGDRTWTRSMVGTIELGLPTPFVEMPIIYERAYGGYDKKDPDPAAHRLDPHNPVGTGFFTAEAHKVGERAPNIEWIQQAQPGPPGFGPVCVDWHARTRYQGTFDAKWIEERKPLLPEDYDPRHRLSAPEDQQFTPHLRGGESIAVSGMHAEGVVRFDVPKHYLAFTTRIGKKGHEHRAKMATVAVFPNQRQVAVTWQTSLSCHKEFDYIEYTRIRELDYIE